MGFYGNITNTSNTTFQFDRIYPNRLAMEANTNNDGIFIGRYVLVEYDQQTAFSNIYIDKKTVIEFNDNDCYYGYSSPEKETRTRIKYGGTQRSGDGDRAEDKYYLGEIGQVQIVYTNGALPDSTQFYQCVGEKNGDALFAFIAKVNTTENNYIKNFAIDEQEYSKNSTRFKGYDSTVWTKVTKTDSEGKLIAEYVNIADLNSVVPTFDVVADAPTMTPIVPHFDADNTNVYYRLHMQAPYGFRIKEGKKRKSDCDIIHYKTYYDKEEDAIVTESVYEGPGDIYYNFAGFDPDNANSKVPSEAEDNYIKLAPTGCSHTIYSHGGESDDIQEFSLHLPAIGNMMSDAWDIIHGPNRDDSMLETDEDGNRIDSLQGRLNSFYEMENDSVAVKRAEDGKMIGVKVNGGKTSEKNYTGVNDDNWIETAVNGNTNTFTIKHKFDKDKSNHQKINNKDSNNDTTSSIDLNDNGGSNTFDINTPIVDSMGHTVGKNVETITLPFGFKTINVSNDTTESAAPAQTGLKGETADNTQDSLTFEATNKWIKMAAVGENKENKIAFGHELSDIETKDNNATNLNAIETKSDSIIIPDWSYDTAGHITSKQKHEYILPYGYKTIKIANNSDGVAAPANTIVEAGQSADQTQDTLNLNASNKWIVLDNAENDTIKFGHKLSDLPKGWHSSSDTTIGEFGQSFKILKYETDEAGHVISSGEDIITIPQGSYTAAIEASGSKEIITSIDFTPSSGAITSTKANTDTLSLSNYSANTNEHSKLIDIIDTDTINNAFKKIQNHINGLNLNVNEVTDDTKIITSIVQKNGQVSLSRSTAGNLQIGIPSADGTIPADSSLNNAFNITNNRIKAEEDALAKEIQDRKDAIDALTGTKDYSEHFDTMKEIADWLDANKDGVVDITLGVTANTNALTEEIGRATAAEQGLQEQIDALGTAAKEDTDYFATAAQGSTADATAATIATYGDIVTYNAEDFVSKEEYNALLSDFNDLKALVEQLNNQINPPQEPDEGGEIV